MKVFTSRGGSARLLSLLLMALLPAAATKAESVGEPRTGNNPTLTLAKAEQLALQKDPMTQALLKQAEALEESAVSASSLPDPMLSVRAANLPVDSFSLSQEPMTQFQVGISQTLPKGDSLALASQKKSQQAQAELLKAKLRAREILLQLRQSWVEHARAGYLESLLKKQKEQYQRLHQVVDSLYSLGRKDQVEVLATQNLVDETQSKIIAVQTQRAAAVAGINRWLEEPNKALSIAHTAHTAHTAQIAQDIPFQGTFFEHPPLIEQHPALQVAVSQIDQSKTALQLAEQQRRPGWRWEVGYGIRQGDDMNGDDRSDFVSVGVTVDLPLFAGTKQNRDIASRRAELSSSEWQQEEQRRQLQQQSEQAFARYQGLERQLNWYETQLLPQQRRQAEAALLSYQRDTGSFENLIMSEQSKLRIETELLNLRIERARTVAQLLFLDGENTHAQ